MQERKMHPLLPSETSMENKTQGSNDRPVINYRGIKAMPFIIGNETFEKLGTVGSSANLAVYLTLIFNMTSVASATLLNVFNGTANLATLIGAFLADTYFGRYKALAFASLASLMGMIILMLTAAVPSLHPPKCDSDESGKCVGPTAWQLAILLSSFGFLVIGAGGIRPCNLAFGADQFDPNTESGQSGIRSFFNWYYFTSTFAVMASVTGIVYVQSDVSWSIGFAIPAFLMLISCSLFFWGTSIYVIVKPQGSPYASVAQVIVAATKKRGLKLPEKSPQVSLFEYNPPQSINSKLPHTNQFRFLDKAAIVTNKDEINLDGSATNPWILCSIQQVEEVKCLIRLIPILASTIIYGIPINQQATYSVFQAFQMDRRLGNSDFKIPAGTYAVFNMLAISIWIPIYDRIVAPFVQRLTGKVGGFTYLQRIGIGMAIAILCMLVSGLVEDRRRDFAFSRPTLGLTDKGYAISSLSGMYLVPQLALCGLSEAFSYIGLVEFLYQQFPENMRSIAQSFLFASIAISSYMCGFLVSIVHHISKGTRGGDWLDEDLNEGKLDYFYYLIAGLTTINFVYYLVFASWYRYKAEDENSTIEMTSEKERMHFV